jgi:flagellar assembly protein FliH
MSSSKVYSRFTWTEDAHPVGDERFIDQFLRQRAEESSEGQLIKQLEQQHQAELEQAFQNGYAKGESVGLKRGMDEARRVEAQLAATYNSLLSFRQTIYEQAKPQLVELALAIANKITTARGAVEHNTVIETIDRCIGEILDKTRMKIRVNPAELDFVKQRFDELVKRNEAAEAAVVESDNRVSAGGCIIETDSGSADARIESQLRMFHEKLIALE